MVPLNTRPDLPQAAGLRLRLRWLLLWLVLAVLVPVLVSGGFATWHAVQGRRAASEQRLRDTATALSHALDRELGGVVAALQVFAASTGFHADPSTPDLARLDPYARRIAQQLGVPLAVIAPDGQVLLATLRQRDEALPRVVPIDVVERAVATGRPMVGYAVTCPICGRRVIPVIVPVPNPGGRPNVLVGASIDIERLRSLLTAPELSGDLVASVTDSHDIVAARSDAANDAVANRPVPPGNLGYFKGIKAGLFRATGPDDVLYVYGFHNVASAPGWTVFVAQRADSLDAAWRRPLLNLAVGTVLAFAIGAVLALGTARLILVPVRRLVQRARAIAAGQEPADHPVAAAIPFSPVVEIEALRQALADAEAAQHARLRAESDAAAARIAHQQATRVAKDLDLRVKERTRALTEAAVELRTEMRRREEAQSALLQTQKLEALGQLTSGVAHDFNNVLAVITGSFRLIENRVTEPRVLELIQRGDRAAERGAALVRQLVAFARREDLKPEEVNLQALLTEVEDMVHHTIGRHLAVSTQVAPDTWPVLADRHQLEVALINLAVNARDAMPRGGSLLIAARNLDPTERPGQQPPGDQVLISVRDNGDGMPPEVLARATEPFFTTKPKGKGTGLGLAMVGRFAEQSNGRLRIESSPGAGTTIELVLPRAAVIGLPAPQSAAADEAPAAGVLDPLTHGRASILVVEDDEQVRLVTATFLRDLGYTVTDAANAEAAEALAQAMEAIDLLVTDVSLPGVDGPALAARLRIERPSLPVLFITGCPPGPALQGEAVLRKPVAGPDLAGAVLECLNRRRHLRAPSPAQRLLTRLHTPALRAIYLAWHAARAPGEDLPRPEAFDLGVLGLEDDRVLVAVEGDEEAPGFRFLFVGSTLTTRLGHCLDGTTLQAASDPVEIVDSTYGTYRRCVQTGGPVYEAARFDFGDGKPMRFERFMLPLSENGRTVTHLAGIALFEDAGHAGKLLAESA
jgi:signal transduction histidine kinase